MSCADAYEVFRNILRKTDGAFSESIVAKGDVQMKVPDNISDVDAATQGVALVTMVKTRSPKPSFD